MTDKRVVILENGTATIGGVEYVLVPKEPVAWIQRHAGYADRLFFASQIDDPRMYKWAPEVTWEPLLSAAATDQAERDEARAEAAATSKETKTWSPKKQTLLTR